ncbi:MaoC family dehydratase [Massilia glaciei]|uniref:MaoC family dehydratase n=1 Tax=Massilia glaciei TaxID=1524097 RepID=A0A2U2HJJ3_9BURK|nr:MaoC family dehydratase [Massilia glaciei]PWF47707.1 MaoC family dehydratase [Massilia glaciei]
MREISHLADFRDLIGVEVAVSDWFEIDQRRIDTFADATNDHQWIHLDAERCARESPYKTTIAHGFLTLSLLPAMLESALAMKDVKLGLNYGLNRVRFPAPVPVDSRLRARLTLRAMDDIEGGAQLGWSVVVEREGSDKPVCAADLLLRCFT